MMMAALRVLRWLYAISLAASHTPAPRYWAAVLDVWGFGETGRADELAAGGCPGVPIGVLCSREQGARYCSPWMVRCELVPVGSGLVEQAAIALETFKASAAACPSHPFGRFAGVGCHASTLVNRRNAAVARALAGLR